MCTDHHWLSTKSLEPPTLWLLIDNSSTHALTEGHVAKEWRGGLCGFTWKNINAVFLLPNVTLHVQPLDQGMILAWRAAYQRRHVSWIIFERDGAYEQLIRGEPITQKGVGC
jgi:hypothetical protein